MLISKLSYLVLLLASTYLYSMEVDQPNKIEEQRIITDSRLLLDVPKEILANVARYRGEDRLYTVTNTLIKLSLVCKKLESLRTPDTIKALLNLDQQYLDMYLFLYNKNDPSPYVISFVRLLLNMGADVNKTRCLLSVQCSALAQLFIDHGANINQQDEHGDTSLHIAIKDNKIDIVKVLLQNKADMYLFNKNGKTPITYALNNLNPEYIDLFIEYGLDPSIRYTVGQMELSIDEWRKTFNLHTETYKNITNPFKPSKLEVIMEPLMTEKPIFNKIVEIINNSCSIS